MDAKSFARAAINRVIVSIHAPVMDANFKPQPLCKCQCFNPRARDGREHIYYGVLLQTGGFNPRARDGRELQLWQWSL